MRAQRLVRVLAAGGLITAGWLLSRAARGVRQAAESVSLDGGESPAPTPFAQPVPAVGIPDAPSHARVPETQVDELAAKPAVEVIAAIDGLSTDELGRLYEHEQAHKQRKTVLQAIEKALSPAS